MPIPYFLVVAAQIFFIVHAARTGRPYYWIPIILIGSVLGIIAYVAFELLPGSGNSPAARSGLSAAKRLVDPTGSYRQLAAQLELTPTVANKRALADECVRLGRLDEAEALYRESLEGMHATNPYSMLGLARVHFARKEYESCLSTLADIKASNPDFQSADAHMLYARSLELLGREAEAAAEYESLSLYFGGEEPRVRHALLLRKLGDPEAARRAFAEIKKSVERAPAYYRRNQREWYNMAKENLKS